jgi:putative protease
MGVASIKLEGRMKRPEYVATVTRVYRQALNSGNVTKAMVSDLHTAFNRQGFTDGYYAGNIGKHMFGIREDTAEDNAWLKEVRQSYESTENPLVPIRFQASVTRQESYLTVIDPEGRSCTVRGRGGEPARTQELTAEALSQRLYKTGGTPFLCVEAAIHVEPGLMLSAAAINSLRLDVLNQLTALRARRDPIRVSRAARIPHFAGSRSHPELTVQVTSREQVTGRLLKMQPKVLYVPLHLLAQDPAWCRQLCQQVHVCAVLPRIVHDGELPKMKDDLRLLRSLGVDDALVGNLGLLIPVRECGLQVRGDFGLNLYNSGAVNIARDLELRSATLSFEMTLPQIRDVSKAVPCELLVYGRLPLMVTENCLTKGKNGTCTCHLTPTKLVDKTGAEFPVIKDGSSCRSVLLNGKKLSLLDRQNDLEHLGLWAVRLYFTTENPREVDLILASRTNPMPFDPGSNTRGLYLRGVD